MRKSRRSESGSEVERDDIAPGRTLRAPEWWFSAAQEKVKPAIAVVNRTVADLHPLQYGM
jgi:hypothetical protein